MPAPAILFQMNDFTSLATNALKINLRTIIKHFRQDYLPAIWTVFHPHDRIPLEGNGTLICPLLSILMNHAVTQIFFEIYQVNLKLNTVILLTIKMYEISNIENFI